MECNADGHLFCVYFSDCWRRERDVWTRMKMEDREDVGWKRSRSFKGTFKVSNKADGNWGLRSESQTQVTLTVTVEIEGYSRCRCRYDYDYVGGWRRPAGEKLGSVTGALRPGWPARRISPCACRLPVHLHL